MSPTRDRSSRISSDDPAWLEAGEWLARLLDAEPDPEEPYPDLCERQDAFITWLTRSPAHVRAFLEIMEAERRLLHFDPQRFSKLQELLQGRAANVIPLHGSRTENARPGNARRRASSLAAAVVAALAGAAVIAYVFVGRGTYATGIGEQRTCKLEDGSVIVLNTNTRIKIDLSRSLRSIRLMQGEAFFIAEHDAHRPFIVNAGNATVRAVGTAFNIRRRAQATEVAVIDGAVQVFAQPDSPGDRNVSKPDAARPSVRQAQAADTNPAVIRVTGGEKVQVENGVVRKSADSGTADVVSWRQRRLVFRNTSFVDIAQEFNRYNHSQIRVAGPAAQARRLTGIFDADHPQAFVLFAAEDPSLAVESEGGNWVIRGRASY